MCGYGESSEINDGSLVRFFGSFVGWFVRVLLEGCVEEMRPIYYKTIFCTIAQLMIACMTWHASALKVGCVNDDLKQYPDESSVDRDPNNECKFQKCPEIQVCSADAHRYPDGSSVGRDPNLGCAFKKCPEIKVCSADAHQCPDGSSVGRDPNLGCEFQKCPKIKVCSADA